ncbi:hypothetical protein Tco_0216625 [Tanacetum coccineum]
MCSYIETGGSIIIFPFGSLPVFFLTFGDSNAGSEVDTENTGSDVDGKENVYDGDGIENVDEGICEVIVKFYE